jgi:hypothetical protein
MRTIKPLLLAAICLVLSLCNTASAFAAGKVTQRPISDFISQQGTFCIPDGGGGCFLFVPLVPNYVGWGDPTKNLFALIDYAGVAARYIVEQSGGVINLGTQTTGTIIERTLPSGKAEVSVNLRTTNALSWVIPIDFNNPDFSVAPIFGSKAAEVLRSNTAALATVELRVTFINSAPGAPLPDLIQVIFNLTPQDTALFNYAFQATARGLLCDGSAATLTVSQTGNVSRSNVQAAIVNLTGSKPRCP